MQARRGVIAAALAAVMLGSAAASALAMTGPYAPLGRAGPQLRVPGKALRRALTCKGNLRQSASEPILLIPGTGLTPGQNFSWTYERAFAQLSWPYCALSLPFRATGDVSIAGQYAVYSLRTMARLSHRRVDTLGYSQGGMLPRWALRFWPDTRALVHDVIGIDPSNHGTLDPAAACVQQCPPAYWQLASGSRFLSALNSRAETFAGIDYTVIFSRAASLVVPRVAASASASLHTGTGAIANISVQRVCPKDAADHLAMGSYDPVAYALALDALTHPGTGSAARIPSAVCAQPFVPTVEPSKVARNVAGVAGASAKAFRNSPRAVAEPALPCYAFAACPVSSR